MKCMSDKKFARKSTYPKDLQGILKAIIKHQKIEEDTEFPFGDEEISAILEANLVWVMNNVDIPFEKWKAIFRGKPKYLKRLSDIAMTFSFEEMVKNGEAVELKPESPDGKPIYMKKEVYELYTGEEENDPGETSS